MAVTKRTRFEVLRRDEHTCQYCGGKAPDVVLQIDHVVPVALGGDDKPSNLVTACKDCNAGKSSIPPDSPIVQGLTDRAAAYALGMVGKMKRLEEDLDALEEYSSAFWATWNVWGYGQGDQRKHIPLPADWENSLFKWMSMGVPVRLVELAVPTAMEASKRKNMRDDQIFTYMSGIIWNQINDREIDHSTTNDRFDEGYEAGFNEGWDASEGRRFDVVANHIDGLRPKADASPAWLRWSPSFAAVEWRDPRNGVHAIVGLKGDA